MIIKFRHSIRFKIAIIVFLTTLFTIFVSWSVSNHFIEQFYISHTKNMLIGTFNSCNEFFAEEDNLLQVKNDEIISLYGYVNNPSGASIFIIDPVTMKIFSSIKMNEMTEEEIYHLIDEYDFSKFLPNAPYRIKVRDASDYEQSVGKYKLSGSYYDLVGLLDSNLIVIIRTPVQNVSDNITFAAHLFTSVSMALLIFEVIVVLLVTNIFSYPIIEMSRVARKMANMDFSAKVDVRSSDEIGELGECMNNMSYSLEKSITELKEANLELSNDIRKKEQIEEMRSEFLSHVSHELKTPLALIQGYAEGIKSGVADDPETMEYYCDVISDEASKMNELVMKLISLNQIEYGDDMSIERFDITKLIEEVINNSSILIQDKDVKIIYEEKGECFVWADSFMIEEVITNYLTNAIHYVCDNGEIRVWFERKEDTVRINVYNEGDNISDEDLKKLFIKFYKTDAARTRTYGGSGIGLSIVEAIMKAHNKEYGVYNVEKGVVFYFEVDTKAMEINSDN